MIFDGIIYLKKDRISVGRHEDNDIELKYNEGLHSRRHAVLIKIRGSWFVNDSSTNGTYINSKKIGGLQPIVNGDVLTFGYKGGHVLKTGEVIKGDLYLELSLMYIQKISALVHIGLLLDLLYNSKASNYWPQGNNKENINNKYNYIRRNLPYVLKERDKSRLLEVKDDLEMMLKTGVGPVSPSDLVHESVDNAITSNVTSNNNNNNSLLINNDDSTLNNYQGLSTNETTSHNIQNHHNSPNDTFFKNTKTNKNNNYDDNTNNNNTKTKKNNKTNKSKYGALNNARTLWGNDEDYEEDGDDEDYSFHGKKPKKRAKLDHVEKKSKEMEKNKTHVDNGYDNNGDAEEEENEQCQHSNCLRPTSSIVNWVQCDDCDSWLHVECIGVDPKVLKTSFFSCCGQCEKNTKD